MMSSNMENVAPNVLRTVLKQAQALVQEKMEGIHVLLNDDDMTDIQVGLTELNTSEFNIFNSNCLIWIFNVDTFHFLLNPLFLFLFLSLPVSDQWEFTHWMACKIFNFPVSLIGCSGFFKPHSIGWVISTFVKIKLIL